MERARVVVFEDNPKERQSAAANLAIMGHAVVAEAANTSEALAVLERMASGELEVDVVLLDGNLSEDSKAFEDAKQIAEAMKSLDLTTPVLGFSMSRLAAVGIPVWADTYKEMREVDAVIRDL